MHARSRSGFSLMEIIVATAIIAMITGISVTYNHSSEDQLRIFKSQALLVGALNRAKSYATERFIGKNIPLGSFACAFGVHIDKVSKKVVIFEDIKADASIFTCLNADGSYSPSLSVAGGFYSGASEALEEIPFDPLLAVSLPNGGEDILFVPPDPAVMANGAFPVTVRIAGSGGRYSDTTVMAGGQIIAQ